MESSLAALLLANPAPLPYTKELAQKEKDWKGMAVTIPRQSPDLYPWRTQLRI
jgi:hypothetical protein